MKVTRQGFIFKNKLWYIYKSFPNTIIIIVVPVENTSTIHNLLLYYLRMCLSFNVYNVHLYQERAGPCISMCDSSPMTQVKCDFLVVCTCTCIRVCCRYTIRIYIYIRGTNGFTKKNCFYIF